MAEPTPIARTLVHRLAWAIDLLGGATAPPAPDAAPDTDDGPMPYLAARLALTPAQLAALWLLASLQLAPAAWRLARELVGDESGLPVVVLRDLLRRAGHAISAAELDGLQAWALVEPSRQAGPPRLAASARVVELCTGELRLAPDVAEVATLSLPPDDAPAATDEPAITLPAGDDARALVLVRGRPGVGRRRGVLRALHARGEAGLIVDEGRASLDDAGLERLARALRREAVLWSATPVLLLDDTSTAPTEAALAARLARLHAGLLVVIGRTPPPPIADRDVARLDVALPDAAARRAAWHAARPELTSADAARLADEFTITPATIAAAARRAGAPATFTDAARAITDQCSDAIARFATARATPHRWPDLVLPRAELQQLADVVSRCRHGRQVFERWGLGRKVGHPAGVAALLSGPPGTGKTMAAGVIAAELGYRLMQVDLARVVSKFIGETEANLAALFDAADGGGVALLFDEADSLFGRRTEVKSAHDRHANMETNFILQRLESFSGLVLLTTNHEDAIDPAVQRRLAAHVRVPVPDARERLRIWRGLLDGGAPCAPDLDLARLAAEVPLTGGYIKNAVLRAAFAAAAAATPITQAMLDDAAEHELASTGRITAARERSAQLQ